MIKKWWWVIALAFALAIYVIIKMTEWRTMAKVAIQRAESSAKALDSARLRMDSLLILVGKRDSVIVKQIRWLHDTVPILIGTVDSAACAPVIWGLRECVRVADSAKAVAHDYRQIVDSLNPLLDRERQRGDELLAQLKKPTATWVWGLPRPKCVKGIGGGYDPFHNRFTAMAGVLCGF